MAGAGPLFGRRAESDDGFAGHQNRAVGLVRFLNRRGYRLLIMAVNRQRFPAGGFETFDLVDGTGFVDGAVNGDVVIVPENDQLV